MNRVRTAIVVLSGSALFATQLIPPADSSPRVPSAAVEPRDRDEDQQDPTLEAMRSEVDRLRERTKPEPASTAPVRDPFSFGRPAPLRPARGTPAGPSINDAVPEVRQVVLPKLVAVLVNTTADGQSRTAVFTAGDSIDLIALGENVGAFRVDTISSDGVDLVHRDSGARYSLSLH